MLAVISPAKSLDFATPLPPLVRPALQPTEPVFDQEADRLAQAASKLSEKKLSELMHISPKLAKLNAVRFRSFAEQPRRPAIFAFAGDVYAGFEVHSLDEEGLVFAQDHLRILSGLYGVLRPLDAIRAYRLEMGTKWAPRRKDLYAFWGNKVAEQLASDLDVAGSRVVINLASKEYWRAVDGLLPRGTRVIDVDFREQGPEGLRFVTFSGKRARGMMARYICEHRLDDPEQIRGFEDDGYRFNAQLSDDSRWLFVRG